MVDELNYTNILNGNYSFYKTRYFFGFGDDYYSWDGVRIIKLLYILISFILYLLIIISIIKEKKRKFSVALQLTGNILIMNFLHTFTYSFEWVLKEQNNNRTLYINATGYYFNNISNSYNESISNNEEIFEVGGLLVGNMDNIWVCQAQGFLLVFSSICQDNLINIFFYIVNKPKIPSKRYIRLILITLGYCFPLIFSFIYLILKGYGLNDKYCYIKKFDFKKDKYIYNNISFKILVIIIYVIRVINLLISGYLLKNIWNYVKENKLEKIYILKTSAILIIQIVTILIGFLYRIISVINDNVGRKITNTFLCINTLDGILFPLYYSLSNGVFKSLFCGGYSNKDSLETIADEEEEGKSMGHNNSTSIQNTTGEKTFAMVDVKDDNNFDLSYA